MSGRRTPRRAALYARVSTTNHGQDPEVQLMPLRAMAKQKQWKVVGEFVDIGVSGAKESRPELDRLMDSVRSGKVDAVVVSRFDRFARSTRHLLDALELMRTNHVDFISISEAVDTSSSVGRMVLTFLAGVAEFERELVRERVKAGLAKAKAEGKHLGRPRRDFDLRPVLALKEKGHSIREISKMMGVPRTTIRRRLSELEKRREGSGPQSLSGDLA